MLKYNFKKFEDINNNISIKLNKIIFGNHPRHYNKNIFNNKAINLSGSTVINLYNNLINNTTEIILNNDLDIYVDLSTILQDDLNVILMDLFKSGYYANNNDYIETVDDDNDVNCNDCQYIMNYNYFNYKYLISDLLNNLYSKNINKTHINIELNNEYENLSKYIYHVKKYTNMYTNQKIDIIFMKCDIQLLLLESFDFDIVKNYYNKGYLYIYNQDAIQNKIATVTLNHFNNNIIIDSKKLNKFILRYYKYQKRGYRIFIDIYEIKVSFINKLLKLLLLLFNINFDNAKCYYEFNNNNISDFIKTFFIKYILIDEELMKFIFHPSKIQELLELDQELDIYW